MKNDILRMAGALSIVLFITVIIYSGYSLVTGSSNFFMGFQTNKTSVEKQLEHMENNIERNTNDIEVNRNDYNNSQDKLDDNK